MVQHASKSTYAASLWLHIAGTSPVQRKGRLSSPCDQEYIAGQLK